MKQQIFIHLLELSFTLALANLCQFIYGPSRRVTSQGRPLKVPKVRDLEGTFTGLLGDQQKK